MRKLLNTLFVLTEDAYLTLDGENVVLSRHEETLGRFPLHTLEGILCFSYAGASPALMGACGRNGIDLSFLTPTGRFLARVSGENHGNVLLRRTQYRAADDLFASCRIARWMIFGKVYNARWTIERTIRDHGTRIDAEKLAVVSRTLADFLPAIRQAGNLEELRGLEGKTATQYFGVLDDLILNQKQAFAFHGRSRRPPMDGANALLSFTYTLLARDCAAALESVGLDPYVGFLHRDRAGRESLALDLMEELRAPLADRFVLTLINNRQITEKHLQTQESEAVLLTDEGRKKLLSAWQERKREIITHPYLGEKLPWGLVPYVQALLLARYFREDLDGYPPFLWK